MQWLAMLFVPVVLDTLFLTLGGLEHTPAVWIGFSFANLAYIIYAVSVNIKKHSEVLNRTNWMISFAHFVIQFIVFLFSLSLGWLSTKASIVIHTLFLLCFVVVFMTSFSASDRDTKEEEKLHVQRSRIQSAQLQIDNVWRSATDPACKKALERLSDNLKSCQFSDSPNVAEFDKNILYEVSLIRDYVADGKLEEAAASITRATDLLRNRDIEIRMNS